jgi:chromosome segregation ATPase
MTPQHRTPARQPPDAEGGGKGAELVSALRAQLDAERKAAKQAASDSAALREEALRLYRGIDALNAQLVTIQAALAASEAARGDEAALREQAEAKAADLAASLASVNEHTPALVRCTLTPSTRERSSTRRDARAPAHPSRN